MVMHTRHTTMRFMLERWKLDERNNVVPVSEEEASTRSLCRHWHTRWDKQNLGILVSTAFVGMDFNFCEDDPAFFETMVFGLTEHAELQWRHAEYEEAMQCHREVCRAVIRQLSLDMVIARHWALLMDQIRSWVYYGRMHTPIFRVRMALWKFLGKEWWMARYL